MSGAAWKERTSAGIYESQCGTFVIAEKKKGKKIVYMFTDRRRTGKKRSSWECADLFSAKGLACIECG